MIIGKHYNRGIRVHKLFLEALSRMQWQEFETGNSLSFSDDVVQLLSSLRRDLTMVNAERFLSQAAVVNVRQSFIDFTASNHGPTAEFWKSYCDVVSLLLTFLRATREGNWSLHVRWVRQLLPWMFAYDRHN